MMKAKLLALALAALMLISASACNKAMPAPKQEFPGIADYQSWANETGYPSGALTAQGVSGINPDRFRTLPGEPGYDSGRIVIGDSRCCQLGIYALRAGLEEHATFAVWGGHYNGSSPAVFGEDGYAAVEECFRHQASKLGSCRIWFFATVNDYDCVNNDNAASIAAALDAAQRLAEMTCSVGGREIRPYITVVGIEGGAENDPPYWVPDYFNRYIDDYNEALRAAIIDSGFAENINSAGGRLDYMPLRTVSAGTLDFIDDGLHYGDATLAAIERTIAGR